MPEPASFAYLDHNVLDFMTKGDPDGIANLIQRADLTPVFSDETLIEIQRSTGYEEKFLDVLEQIGVGISCRSLTGNTDLRVARRSGRLSRMMRYRAYVDNVSPLPDTGFSLTGMLQKFYGGRQDRSYGEIFSRGTDELRQLLRKMEEDLADGSWAW